MKIKNGNLSTVSGMTLRIFIVLIVMTLLLVVFAGISSAVTPWYASVGSHIVLLNPDGTVWCIGNNKHGQLGIGSNDDAIHEPVKVVGLINVKAVAAGGSHSVALLQDGTVWTWGGNSSGQLGIGSKTDSDFPVQVDNLRDVIAIASGRSHVTALKSDGTVWAWGSNYSGQLGIDSSGTADSPVQVGVLQGVTAIAAGAFHSAALKKDGTVWAWGFNGNGQLGNGTCESYNIPVKVSGLNGVVAIAAGNQHMAALQNNGAVWAWGSNHASQLGVGSSLSVSMYPLQVSVLSGVMDISAKVNHTFALMQDGTVVAWGDTGSGQWGNGVSMNGSPTPVRLRGVSSLISIAAVGNPDTLVQRGGAALSGGYTTTVKPEEIVTANENPDALTGQISGYGTIVTADASRFFRY